MCIQDEPDRLVTDASDLGLYGVAERRELVIDENRSIASYGQRYISTDPVQYVNSVRDVLRLDFLLREILSQC